MPLTVADFNSVTLEYKKFWGDSWSTGTTDIEPVSLELSTGGTIDRATLIWRQGEIYNPADTAPDLFEFKAPPLDNNYYVRFKRTSLPLLDWIGYIVSVDTTSSGRTLDGSQSFFKASVITYQLVGMEYFLDRKVIGSTVHYTNSPNPGQAGRSNRAIGFNTGVGEGRGVSHEDRGNRDSRKTADDIFAFSVDKEHRELWSADQIVEHLLKYHQPINAGSPPAVAPFEFKLYSSAVVKTDTSWLEPTIRVEGKTLFAVLNDLFNPRRGLVWWIEWQTGTQKMFIYVNTVTDTAITLPKTDDEPPKTRTIPVASFQSTIDFDSTVEVKSSKHVFDATRLYDQILVRGARRTATFTISKGDLNLEKAWGEGAELEYIEAFEGFTGNPPETAQAADRYRRKEKLKSVYTEFRIPEDWDGKAASGDGKMTPDFVCPKFTYITGQPPVKSGGEKFNWSTMRLSRQLPLKDGWDYTDAEKPVEGSRDEKSDDEFMAPLAVTPIGPGSAFGRKWVPMNSALGAGDEDDEETESLKTSYGMSMLVGTFGVEVRASGKLPHALGKDEFDFGNPDPTPSDTEPEIRYREIRLTVCAEWDAYCQFEHPSSVSERVGDPVQQLLIDIGDRARFDWLAEGTVFDIDKNDFPDLVETGGAIRDDRKLCETIAQAAYTWYNTPRGTFHVSFANWPDGVTSADWWIGNLVTVLGVDPSVNTDDQIAINATLTKITYNFQDGTVSLDGGFGEIDFGGLI